MPINTRIGRLVQESIAMRQAKGKHSGSYANSLFGSVSDMFYEFGLVSRPSPKKTDGEDKRE